MVAPSIQKGIIDYFAQEILKHIFDEIGDDVFSLLVNESSDVSKKEQMTAVLHYVTCGIVKERFVGLVHVKQTNALSLKSAIESLFAEHKVSLKKVRGQGYDGASNMRGEFNVVVAVAKKHLGVRNFFDMIAVVMNVVCASCKQKDMVRESQKEKLEEAIGSGELETESGLNQEFSLSRVGDTRWSSHYKILLCLVDLFPIVVEVLEYVEEEGNLQRKDQDILNAMSLVKSTKRQLQKFRVDGFYSLLKKISSFCEKYDIEMLNMGENDVNLKNQRQKTNITYQHYYEFKCFTTIVDMQIKEFGDRFSEVSSDLLICMAALNPHNSFHDFDPSKLLKIAGFCPYDFNCVERMTLEHELDIYFDNMQEDDTFANLKGISDLARVMVETRKYLVFPLVYQLLKLALVLPVAISRVERCFSVMELVKSNLHNRIFEDYLNDCVICTVENEGLVDVTNEDVMNRFQKMKFHREQL